MVAGLAAGMAALLGAHQSSPSGRLALPVSQLGSPSAGGPQGPPGHGGPAGGPVWRLHCPALAAAAGPGSAEPRTWPLVNSFTLANLVARPGQAAVFVSSLASRQWRPHLLATNSVCVMCV